MTTVRRGLFAVCLSGFATVIVVSTRSSVAVQQAATPTTATETDIAVLRAELQEMRRSQEHTLDSITIISSIAAGIGVVLVTGAAIVVGVNVSQGNKAYDRDREHLQKVLRDDFQLSLQSTREQLAGEYSEQVDRALEAIRPTLEKLIRDRFEQFSRESYQHISEIQRENQSIRAHIDRAIVALNENDVRIMMQQAGLPRPSLGEYDSMPPTNPIVDSLLDLIDLAKRTDAVLRALYFLESYLRGDSVTLNSSERDAISQRLARHGGLQPNQVHKIEQLMRAKPSPPSA